MPVENNITIQASANINVGGTGGAVASGAAGGRPIMSSPYRPEDRYAAYYGLENTRFVREKEITAELEKQELARAKLMRYEQAEANLERQKLQQLRMQGNSLLAMQMTLLGINFSTMMFVSSLHKAGVLTEEQYKIATQLSGVLSTILSFTQMILAVEQLLNVIEWSKAAAKIAQYGLLAPMAAAAAGIAIAAILGYMYMTQQQAKKAAKGAYVPATPGGMMFIVGEGGQNEVISPEPMLRQIVREESGSKIIIYAMDSEDVIRGLKRAKMEMDLRGDKIW